MYTESRNYGYTTLSKRKRYNCDKDSNRSHIPQNFQNSGNEMSHKREKNLKFHTTVNVVLSSNKR